MPRIATTQALVLQRVAARIIAQIPTLFGTANCYLTDVPDPAVDKGHGLFIQVSPGDGQFDERAQAGAAHHTPFEQSLTWVTVFQRMKLDQPDRAEAMLTHATEGLLPLKRLVLKALTGHDLQDGVAPPDGPNEILTGLITPVSASQPRSDWEGFNTLSIAFDTSYEWDLS